MDKTFSLRENHYFAGLQGVPYITGLLRLLLFYTHLHRRHVFTRPICLHMTAYVHS